ncbi:MAG TPA: response regulator transcription factor, partial [Solirubrobacteraceae bacterium]|nr:response regulator transcription factor [Solirubrobacteraceae bacterium]
AIAQVLDRDPGISVVGRAAGGEEALAMVGVHDPDVLILDLHMPDCGGIRVLERLRESGARTRVLIMTASESPDSLLDAVNAGAQGYITKRSTGEEVRQAVITTYGDGSVIESRMARHLLRHHSSVAAGDLTSLRPVLSDREQSILKLVADGYTDNEIGRQLYISPRTVQNHLTRIREKTGLRRRSELTRWAVQHAMA